MKNNMKRIWAITLAVMMIFSMVPGAMAAEYYSGSLSVGGRVKITAAPTKAPTPAPEATDEPVESIEPGESIEPVESVEPTDSIEPTESPEPTESIEPSASPEAPVEETPLPEETEATLEPAYEARQAVVAKSGEVDTAFLREGPSTDYERVGKVRNGTIVTVLGEENGWAFIEVDGMQAWISGSFLSFDLSEPVEPEETATPEPTVEPTATPEASAEPTDGLEDEIEYLVDENGELVLDENGNPIPVTAEETEVTEEPVATEETQITFERDEEGNLILDENGNPIAIVPEGMEAQIAYLRDENGALLLDENGNPAVKMLVQATEEPAEESELHYIFVRDENGNLVFDEQGFPVVIVPEGWEIPCTYLLDENGNLVLDENGDPIVKDTIPAEAERILTLEDQLNPDRYIDIYLATPKEELFFGHEASLVAVLYGYDNVVYSLQWQTSSDGENWTDVPGADSSRMTVTVTEENYLNYWQIQVTITDVVDSSSVNE